MTPRRSIMLATFIALAMAMMAVAVVQATPPTGQTASTPVIGTLDGGGLVNTDRIKFQAKDQVDVAT
jgi:hypothetical protein